jgi:pectinesterase inhibitor-like protein
MCDLKSKDYSKANIDASAAMDSSSTCEDGFREREGVVSPLTKETNTFFQLTAIMLAFINMLSRS